MENRPMTDHPAISSGRTAVITGGASGIGLAAAEAYVARGMRVVIADVNQAALAQAEERLAERAQGGAADVLALATDVSKLEDVERLRDAAYARFGEVAVLMNNAGTGSGGGPFDSYAGWQRVLGVNLWGVINGQQAFTQRMIDQGTPCAIINTGSKQGITCPPGDTAYNVSKAGIKVATEGLAHALRSIPGCQVTAHLLVPGFVFTTLTRHDRTEKPPAAWLPDQVVDFLLPRLAAGDFYIICPDNDVTRETDNKRMRWAMDDIIRNRPALSRWHPAHEADFAQFLQEPLN
jgi:NAD(P)-dependent dehydrogenase (short-subunit alcohol dehydrogenase family)